MYFEVARRKQSDFLDWLVTTKFNMKTERSRKEEFLTKSNKCDIGNFEWPITVPSLKSVRIDS